MSEDKRKEADGARTRTYKFFSFEQRSAYVNYYLLQTKYLSQSLLLQL